MANMFFFLILLKNDKDLNLSKRVDQKLEAEEAERKICWWCTCSRSSLVRRILPAGLSVSSSPPAPAALHVSHMSSLSLRVQRFLYIEILADHTERLALLHYGFFVLTVVRNKVWKCSWKRSAEMLILDADSLDYSAVLFWSQIFKCLMLKLCPSLKVNCFNILSVATTWCDSILGWLFCTISRNTDQIKT